MTNYLKTEEMMIYLAYQKYIAALRDHQGICEHKIILAHGGGSDSLGTLPFRRICEDCGLEETTPYNSGWKTFLGRAYNVDWKEFVAARAPYAYVPEGYFEQNSV